MPECCCSPRSPLAALTPFVANATTTNNSFASLTGVTTLFLAATGSDFAVDVASTGWALTASACVATWSGRAGLWLVQINATLSCSTAVGRPALAVSHNGDVIGSDVSVVFNRGAVRSSTASTGVAGQQEVTTARVVSLAPGDTVQPCGGNGLTTSNVSIQRMHLIAVPLS